MPQVDVAINVYGKPMQTAVALLTLLQHSGQHIGRIWFIEERKQPHGATFERIKERFASRLVHVCPAFWPGAPERIQVVVPLRAVSPFGPFPVRMGGHRQALPLHHA